MHEITVAALQFGTTLDKRANAERALGMLDRLAARKLSLDLVCLPEFFTLRAVHAVDSIDDYVEPEGGALQSELAARACALGAYLVGGSFLQRAEDGRIYNECSIFDRSGAVIGRYRKTHLFDAPGHSESGYVAAGNELLVFDADFGRVGVAICYELRFPEVARTLALAGATVLAVPNSWPIDGINLGADQLRVLLRGTALQNLAYVLHANQFGHVAGLDLTGRSCVIDPKGEVVAQASDTEQTVIATIDLALVQRARETRTTFRHRRPDLYRPEAVFIAPGHSDAHGKGAP